MTNDIPEMEQLLDELVNQTGLLLGVYSKTVTMTQALDVVSMLPMAVTYLMSDPENRTHNLAAMLDRYQDLIDTHGGRDWGEEAKPNCEVTTH